LTDPTPSLRRASAAAWLCGLTLGWLALRVWTVRQLTITDVKDPITFGLLPHDLVHGLMAPPTAYLPELHQGCALLWGAVCAPVLAVAGPTFGSLRTCSLLWQTLLVLAFVALAWRTAGRWGAAAVGALLAFAPPMLVRSSTLGLPDHIDAAALLAVGLLAALRATDEQVARRPAWAALSGLAVGLAVFFLFDALFAGLAVLAALAWWARRQGRTRRLGAAAAAGFAVGLAPFALGLGYWRTPGGARVFERLLGGGEGAGAGLVERTGTLLAEHLPGSAGFVDPTPVLGLLVPSRAAAWGYLAVVLALGLAAAFGPARGRRRDVAVVALAAAGLHGLACLGSGLDLANHFYLLPAWPWLVLAAALGVAGLVERGRGPAIAAGLALLAVALLCPPSSTVEAFGGSASSALRRHVDGERAAHLLGHRLGYERLPEEPSERLLERAVDRSEHRAELLRLYGGQVWREAFGPGEADRIERADEARAALFDAAARQPSSVRAFVLLGGGRAAFREAMETAPDAGPPGAWALLWSDGSVDPWRLGLALGAVSMVDAEALEPTGVAQARATCAALGLWSAENALGTLPFARQAASPWCDEADFAVGFGIGRGLRLEPGAEVGEPPSLAEQAGRAVGSGSEAGWRCALDGALEGSRAVAGRDWGQASGGTSLGLDCLPRR
jgi:hypothetical protein